MKQTIASEEEVKRIRLLNVTKSIKYMKNIKSSIFLYLAVLVTILCSCENKNNRLINKFKNEYTINYKSKNLQFLSIDSIIDKESIDFKQLDANEQILIGTISDVNFVDSLVVFGDEEGNQVYIFSKNGKFIRKIGTKGRGPGEYNNITDVVYNKYTKTIDVLDETPKIISYSINGKKVNEKFLRFADMAVTSFYPIDINTFAIFNNFNLTINSKNNVNNYCFYLVDSNFKAKNRDLQFNGKNIEIAYSSRQFSETEGGNLNFFETAVPLIYKVNNKGLSPAYFINFEGVDKKIYSSDDFIEKYEEKYGNKIPSLSQVYESERYLLVSFAVNRIRKFAVIDKKLSKTIGVSGNGGFLFDCLHLFVSGYFYNDGEKCVTFLYPEKIIELQKLYNDYKKMNMNDLPGKSFEKLLALKVDFDSNPVMLTFKLNK